jgi:hypothetical protein
VPCPSSSRDVGRQGVARHGTVVEGRLRNWQIYFVKQMRLGCALV